MSETVLTIIPAKGRSRRLPNKNRALLRGKPLVQHAVEQAVRAGICGEICVATDDEKIAEIATKAGANVPFFREKDVDDFTSVGRAAYNTLVRYKEELGREFEYVCMLLTTFPLRKPEDIVNCGKVLFDNPELDSAMSFTYSEKPPAWAYKPKGEIEMEPMFSEISALNREQLPQPFYIDGAVYWAKASSFIKFEGRQSAGRIGKYITPPERSVDIDSPFELELCEYLLSKNIQ